MPIKAVHIILATCGFAQLASADPSYQVPLGPRAVSMAGAFSAIADDATALFWNPAGLSRLDYQEFSGNYANLFDSGIKNNFLAFAVPISRRHVFAAGWNRLGFEDSELDFHRDHFEIAYAYRLHRLVSMGLTGKYLRQGTFLDAFSVDPGSGYAFGADVGVAVNPYRGVRLALVGQDVSGTDLHSSDGDRVEILPRNVRGALSYSLPRWGSIAFDIDDRYHAGIEMTPLTQLAIRGGIEDDRDTDESTTYAGGVGIALGPLRFDYAYVSHPTLAATNHFGFTFAFNFNPPLLAVEEIKADDIFASLYKSYPKKAPVEILVRNLSDRPLATTFRAEIPGLTEAQTDTTILLRPGRAERVHLDLVFSERILSHRTDRTTQVRLQAQYKSLQLMRTETSRGKCAFYSAGSIDWSRGVEQAAAYVTPDDSMIGGFARQAVLQRTEEFESVLGTRSVANTMLIVESLAELGIRYLEDRDNPYAKISQTANAIDTVRYPRETLQDGTGDCDDMTVLLAALLESLGIKTYLVATPGHLSLLVDTGLHASHAMRLPVPASMCVIRGAMVGLPIEATAVKDGFGEAWRRGAELWQLHRSLDTVRAVSVDSSWASYPPASLPAAVGTLPRIEAARLSDRCAHSMQLVQSWTGGESLESTEDEPESPASLNARAGISYRAGKIDEARKRLEDLLNTRPQSAPGHNNMAVLLAASGQYATALQHLGQAKDVAPEDPGIWLNMAVVQHLKGDRNASERAARQGITRCGGYPQALRFVPLPGAAPKPEDRSLSTEEAIGAFARRLRSCGTEDLKLALYWKE